MKTGVNKNYMSIAGEEVVSLWEGILVRLNFNLQQQ
jgi:hypothetical protein